MSFKWQGSKGCYELYEELGKVIGKPGCRIEYHEIKGTDFAIVKCDDYEGEPINDIHLCPVDCPDKQDKQDAPKR